MKLYEAIKNIPDDDWLEIFEQQRKNYIIFIGRAPRKHIQGEVLDYDVLTMSNKIKKHEYLSHKVVVCNF